VGVITKDTATGPFAEEWKTTMEGISKDIEQVDLAFILSNAALAVKDEKELVRHRSEELSRPVANVAISGLFVMHHERQAV